MLGGGGGETKLTSSDAGGGGKTGQRWKGKKGGKLLESTNLLAEKTNRKKTSINVNTRGGES